MSIYLPIAALEQHDGLDGSISVRGVVTLIWPYSQSSKRTAILLAEPDFRLRYKKGQVRVQFSGASALALSRSEIIIGDEVVLSLRGARWVNSEAGVVSTPGKSVGLELRFSNELDMEVIRDGTQHDHLLVNNPPSLTPSNSQPQTPIVFTTPQTPFGRIIETFETPLSVSAPTFHQQARKTSGTLVDSPYDPFQDEEFSLRQTKRPRISWGSQKRYRLTDQIPSPQKEENELGLLGDGFEFAEFEDEITAQIQRESIFATTAARNFGDLLATSPEQQPASQESPIPPFSASFSVFRDPSPLFSRTTTTITAPRYSFSSHDQLATQQTQQTQQTQPTISSQDDVFRLNELSSSQLASQQLHQHLQSPQKVREPHQEAEEEEESLLPVHGDIESSPRFIPESPDFIIPQRRQEPLFRSPELGFGHDHGVGVQSEVSELFQGVSQPQSAGFSQNDPGLSIFDPASSFEPGNLQMTQSIMSSPISAEAGPRYPQAEIDDFLSHSSLPAHLQVSNDPGTVADIPGFIPYADDDWGEFHAQGYDVPYYPEIPSQPTQASDYAQEITYPQIHGLIDQSVIPETQESHLEISPSEKSQQERLPVSPAEGQSLDLELSPTVPFVRSEAPETVSQISISTPTKRANAILGTIRDQLSPNQKPSSQIDVLETIEQFTPTSTRKSPELQSPTQISPSLSSLLQHAATKAALNGLRTRTSYYSHLSNLVSTINRFSQYDSTVDVLAIVTRDSARPLRAEKGQKDYFTKFRVTQPGHWPLTTLVSVFRPFKAALPTAKKGEVVLLRDFEGMSLKGGLVGLISSERSSWCVFKRATEMDEYGHRIREKSVGAEETRGPPVEFGEEEREEAETLMEWWEGMGK